jgi:protease I
MKIAVLVEDGYQVLEVWYPYLRLREEGLETVLVGTGSKNEYKSKEGYPAAAQLSVKDADPKSFSGVVIPGGWAPDFLRRHKEIHQFVKTLFGEGKLVAAICHGGWVLVSAGVLKGKRVTGFYAIKDDLINAGAQFSDEQVVVDGNLVTSRNPFDLPAFCGEIIQFLKRGKQ